VGAWTGGGAGEKCGQQKETKEKRESGWETQPFQQIPEALAWKEAQQEYCCHYNLARSTRRIPAASGCQPAGCRL
jgi:hypothetical protein